ncbi:phage baseplate assembly protein [Rhizobiaceae bacterium n13]|uniref:Phage baseplate assembly protein n=1 Tax=Ferirhizobium litorale TaxID=2927786 RepID=A0AAE3QJC7_9HYPH|nr:phage baseplate assembly protein [Fererhizobium litorale]MDI7864290.1 phage baseplate assembly protein [Fererhizobium litorale]MDI7924605.1 phage baseplate assembly protein [Fererhizobium litorale]
MIGKRIELDGTIVEKDGQQFVSGRGLFRDGYTRIHRIEPHGFASSPVKGGQGLLLAPNGDADQAFVVGGEHPGHRPGNLPGGGTAIYDASGNIISLVGTKIRIVAPVLELVGDLDVQGNIHATGTIIDELGNTNHHSH